MRKPLVAGNWKMHGTSAFVTEILSKLKQEASSDSVAEVAVFPPYLFLPQTAQMLVNTPVRWGGQNVYQAEAGAVTGEISPLMLREFGCNYVIVGHSERRQLFGETSLQVAEKFFMAGEHGITPILCVGETKEERHSGTTFEVIASQLQPILSSVRHEIIAEAVIAYEPVWAIGTGLTATPEQAEEMHAFIRQEITKINKSLAENYRIIYGGSVKQGNAAALFAMPNIDGALVGGASLNAKEFLEIVKLCKYS